MAVLKSDVRLRGQGFRGQITLDTHNSKSPLVCKLFCVSFFVTLCHKEVTFCSILIHLNLLSYISKGIHICIAQEARD